MKFKFLAFGLLVAFAACNGEAPANSEEATTETATDATTEASPVAANLDPVCGMTYDGAWEEYSVTDGDTTRFCSSTCKGAFEGNPAKYQKQEAHEGHDDHEGHAH